MKKLLRALLCAGLLALLSVPAFAAQTEAPEQQGDFYLLINGEYAAFSDAAPQIRDGCRFLPFVATFEQLGFTDMTWDGGTQTVTATRHGAAYTSADGALRQGDVTVTLTMGSTTLSVPYEGDTPASPHGDTVQVVRDFTSDPAPYVDPDSYRAYVPASLIADALGYRMGWDSQQGAVILDDVDAILAADTNTYDLMDKYLAYGRSFSEKNQKVIGGYGLRMAMDSSGQDTSMNFGLTVDGDYEMITAGSTAFQFETDLTLDAAMTMDGTDPIQELQAAGELPELPLTIDLDMRGDISDGTFYFQSAALAGLMGQPGLSNAWYKLDLGAIFAGLPETPGMDYAALIDLSTGAADMGFEEYLAAALKAVPPTSVDYTTTDTLAMINALVSDSAFRKTGSSYISTADIEGTQLTLTLYTNGPEVNGYALALTTTDPSLGGMTLDASVKNRKLEMNMSFLVNMEDTAITLTMTMDGVYQVTSIEPVTAPPADAVIIDLMN